MGDDSGYLAVSGTDRIVGFGQNIVESDVARSRGCLVSGIRGTVERHTVRLGFANVNGTLLHEEIHYEVTLHGSLLRDIEKHVGAGEKPKYKIAPNATNWKPHKRPLKGKQSWGHFE